MFSPLNGSPALCGGGLAIPVARGGDQSPSYCVRHSKPGRATGEANERQRG